MKKVFLFLTMLLFAFVGTMRADEVTIGDPTATTTNSYLPTYSLYEKAISQQMYTADEIGMAGTINTLTMWLKNTSSYARNLNVYMKEVDVVEFASPSAWVSMSDADLVGSFSLVDGISSPVETAVELTTPFEYTGAGTLVICLNDVTGSWSSGAGSVVMTTTEYQALYAYRDGTSYDPSNPGVDGTRLKVKSVIMLDITPAGGGGALTTTPDVLDLGNRPNGAWMAPYVFTINGSGTTVNALDFSGNYFTYNAVLPATLTASRPLEVTLTTGEAEEGPVNSTMTVLFGGNRDAQQFNVTANAYNPVEGDVWENAINVTNLPYSDNAPAGIYKNYDLPVATDGADAMYKVTFDNDVMFSAGTAGENPVTAIYPEDFNGQPGPMADNNYVYNGPTVNPGPTSMWFSYSYTGSNTWYGSSAGGGTIFGYRITPAQLQELGLGNCAITTVEAAAREGSYYDLMILKGGETPDLNNIVYYQEFNNYEPFYFFDVNLDEPQFLGDDENIWVMFYSDSPYAAYCGRYPVDTNNGKIWYTTNLSTWYSNTTYTPVIYTRFLELPTGREVTVNLADMKIRESKPAEGQIAEANGNVNGVAKAQMQKANRGNRDVQTLIEEGFEGGIGDWTLNHCHNNTGVTSAYTANTGSYVFRFYYTTAYPQYLISPELSDNNGGIFSFYAAGYDTDYIETFQLGYSTTTNDPSAFTWGSELSLQNDYEYAQYSSVFPAGTKYVAIACTSDDQFYLFIDDILVTAEGGGTPEPPTATYQIEDMFVPAGTYYVAVASTTEEFNVDIATAEVPYPEQAYIISPYDGETNVEAPYLAEWVLGDYTTEMQVLVGTQYPPQTALIDWTDYLVESAFLLDLEPNQSYFMQVNERNASGTTMGEVYAFTTPIDPVEGFAVEEDELYPGDAAVFTWTANRAHKGYNLYLNGEKYNTSLITTNTYSVEDLEYNMDGYNFQVSAVYDAGESALSDGITVYMTGNGSVSGHVYDIDVEHPIAGATIIAIGVDEYENIQEFEFTTDETGLYEGEILAGLYTVGIVTEGYENEAVVALIEYNQLTEADDIITHEFYYPLQQITATEQESDVLVEWSWTPAELIVDFEEGVMPEGFASTSTYPWTITTTNPYEGTYCIKSTCEGQASASSSIEATVDVPYDGKMGFWVRVSSEANYDKFHFYIDGVEQGAAISGQQPYGYKEYTVTEGTHTYKWEYAKDSSVNSNDDCAYVDYVTLYKQDVPVPPTPGATVYNFDDNTMMGWTSLDADGDGNGWVSSANPGIYHNSGVSLSGTGHNSSEAYVISGSYANQTGAALTPDNYLIAPAQISAQAGAQIEFWACAQDESYAAEHFGVAVSTTTATAAAFTTVQEWTMTAKGNRGAEEYSAVRGARQGNWYQYTVDLSSYAGQDIWVAIRHFNCTDMFILNVDDISLSDGSAKGMPRGNRSFVSYNLYRRNNVDAASVAAPTLVAEGIDAETYEYNDAAWATLPFGEYQWGIAATYEGYAATDRSRETATFGFEGGLEGWTNLIVNTDGGEWLHSDDNLGGYDYTELAHTGTGFAMCYSYVDYDGAYDTDAYLVSPQKYSVDANSTIAFWADNANDSYPENFSICVSTAATPTAASFTEVWSGGAKGTGNGGAAVRRSENRYENWRSHEVSLAAYAGQEIWIAFHDVNYDQYEIWIDDVTITYAGSAPTPPTPPTPGPTGDGISEIIWSNVIEKDMDATMTFNVELNNGQSTEGVTIAIVGENHTYNVTMDATGTKTVEVRKGDTYDITVTMAGYTTWNPTGNPITVTEDTYTYDIELVELILPVEGLYVSPTGWAMWEGTGGVTPTPPTPPTPPTGILFEDDFEDGAITNWTTVDADCDGDTWQNATPAAYDIGDAHSGTNCASSWSWNSYTMYPDNWMISPMVDGAASIQYYVATNTAYPDHYGVYASSTGTATSNFTLVFEETAASKGGNGTRSSMTQAGTRDMSAWIEKNIELPAGTKYVAFRHWNSDDMNYLFIDDVTIAGAGRGDRAPLSYKVMLDGIYEGETTAPGFQHNVAGLEEGSTHITSVAPLYLNGMGEWMTYTWTYTSCDHFAGASALSAVAQGDDVKLTWNMPGVNPGPTPPGPGTNETYDFDNSTMQGWTTIDGNNDGYDWVLGSEIGGVYLVAGASLAGSGHNSSADLVCSGSYSNATGTAITPNNFLVSPNKGAYSSITFYACGQDASYVAEHFGVGVATAANPTASDFTMVQEWTMTAKGEGAMSIGRDGQTRAQGSWHEYTADLSAYAGQQIWVAIRHFNCSDMFILDVDDITLTAAGKGERAMWDLVGSFQGTSGYQYGVATDGQNIYTSSWSSSSTSMFYKYDMEGNFIEEFNISGCGQLRDMTYDGEYFYGVANAATIYCVDLANHTLVSQTNSAYGAMRCITYDPERDGFWVVGNWSGNLTLVSRTGAIVQAAGAPTSASGVAYYKDPDGAEHVYYLKNESGNGEVYEYNITTGTMGTSPVYNCLNTTGGAAAWTGSSGGCFVGAYNGKTCLFADAQQSPQLINIYELDGNSPVPPTPVEGILGAMIFRDGEYLAFVEGGNASQYIATGAAAEDATYAVRVVYDGEVNVTYYAMSCPVEVEYTAGPVVCDPVTGLSAFPYEYNGYMAIAATWDAMPSAVGYDIYQDGELLGRTTGTSVVIYNEGASIAPGTYVIGVVAVYANCEADMVTATVTIVDSVDENAIVSAIYPNPTSSDLHINATGMTHITVFNAMGQMVYDQAVSGDEMIINMGQYEAGVYMVRIDTENGSCVKRITVVK